MAIKERKQITGTTEQIQAYAGHEGQIVWDKDKKTFVGMSGTAGKNYPLASKEYADGKYLPLTGGALSGKIVFNQADGIGREIPSEHIVLSGGRRFLDGASLALFGKDKNDARAGGFEIYNFKDESTLSVLQGFPNGSLLWGGKEVERVNTISHNYIRYESGLQFCWGGADIPPNHFNTVANLPVPYANTGYIILAKYTDANAVPSVSVAVGNNKSPSAFGIAAANPQYSWNHYCEWFTIGYWK